MTTVATSSALCRTIAAIVAADMHAAGLSVSELAIRSGVPRATLARALNGGVFRVGPLAKVADVLGRKPSEWFKIAEQQVTA